MAEPTEPKPKTTSLAKVETSVCGLVLNTLEDMKTVAQIILQSKLAPASFDTAEKIFVGLQTGAEIGLKPMQALNSIVVIKGKPTLWGDAPLGLVKRSGLLLEFEEKVTGEGDDMVAYVKSVRTDANRNCSVETTFSVADAKTAGLWKKPGPWTTHPKRMLTYKARAFNLRDNFPDVLFGMHMTEEMYGEEPLPAPESDVPPRDERRRLAVPSTSVDTTRAPVQEPTFSQDTEAYNAAKKKADALAESAVEEKPEATEGAKQLYEQFKRDAETVLPDHPEPAAEEKPERAIFDRVKNEEGRLAEAEAEPAEEVEEPEPVSDAAALYMEVNGLYVEQNGKDFIEFAAYVFCLDESEVSPSKLTEDQLKQIKAYIETNGVAIS